MKKDDLINEGAAMQEGLEKFLQEELAGMASEHSKQERIPVEKNVEPPVKRSVEPPVYGQMDEPAEKLNQIPINQNSGRRTDAFREDDYEEMSDHLQRISPDRRSSQRDMEPYSQPSKQKNVRENSRKQEEERLPSKQKEGKKNEIKGKKMRKKKKKSTLRSFLTFLLVLMLIAMGGLYFLVGSVYNKMDYERADELSSEPMKEDGVTNILLIGNDSRSQGEDGRSDAMILLSISNKTKKIHMTSLLRDMYVEIPGRDGNRLNAAYAYGGPTLLLETIEQNLGIKVNRYVLVNFQAFANLVDAVGGVDLELSNEEVKWVNAYLNEYNLLEGRDITTDYLDESLSGVIHLNGPQALAYCRNRYIGTDFERTNRQRKVISAIVEKMPGTLATNSGELIEGLFPQLTTNLTQSECYSLSLQASKFLTYEIVQSSIPIEGSYKNATIRKMSVLEVDFEMNKEYIRQNIYGEE